MTASIGGRSSNLTGNGKNRLGPTLVKGDTFSEKTGSTNILSQPISSNTVA